MELKENHNSSSNSNSKRIIIKEEIDEGVVEAIVEIVVVVVAAAEVEMDVEMETITTRITIMVVVAEMEMEMVLRKRNVEDVIGEEIEKVEVVGMEVEGIITMVEIPSKVMVVEEVEINRRMARHLENRVNKMF